MHHTEQSAPRAPGHVTFWLIVITLLWGGSFVFNKIGFRQIPPVTFLFLRFTLATAIMGVVCLRRLPQITPKIIIRGGIVGLALCAANFSFVLGVNGTSVSRAGFLNNLFVLVVPLLCYFFWRSRVDRWTLAGIAMALLGLLLLARGGADGFNRGDLLSTVCAVFISLHIIAVSRLLGEEDVYLVTLVQFATVALLGGLLTLCFGQQKFQLGPASVGALLYCAIFPTVICFTLQNTYQRYTTPTQAGLIYTLDPIWSMLGGFILLGERLGAMEWAGCLLILTAVALPMVLRHYRERIAVISSRSTTPY